jgi:hypothetical protein
MSFGYSWPFIDTMLLTETWEAMEYMSIEPPTHVLLATFLGHKSSEVRVENKARNATDAEVSANILPFVKTKQPAPQWMKNSPGLQKAFADLKAKGT